MTKKILLVHGSGSQESLLEMVQPHLAAYATRHGYELRASTARVEGSNLAPQWDKIHLVRAALEEAEYVLWVDCDILIRSLEEDILEGMGESDFQALCLESTPHGVGPNSGVWILRNSQRAKEFLDLILATGPLPNATLNDQATIAHLLGYSYLPFQTKLVRKSPWLVGTGILDSRWNMLHVFHAEAPLIAKAIHYGGLTLEEKKIYMKGQLIRDRLPGWQEAAGEELTKILTQVYPEPPLEEQDV